MPSPGVWFRKSSILELLMEQNKKGRTRNFQKTIPAHINPTDLPDGLSYDPIQSRWRFNYFDNLGKRHWRRVGSKTSTLKQLLSNIDRLGIEKPETFNWLIEEYMKSTRFLDLKGNTQKDYRYYFKLLKQQKTKDGSIGNVLLKNWTTGLCQRLITKIETDNGLSIAKHVHSFLSLTFTFAKNYDYVPTNHATGVYTSKKRSKQQYVQDNIYNKLLAYAKHRGSIMPKTKGSSPYYIYSVMEIAYLCRLRGVEVRTITEDFLLPHGVKCERRKGSLTNIILYSDRLLSVLDHTIIKRNNIWKTKNSAVPISASDRCLIVNNDGQKISASAYHSAWQKFIKFAIADKVITNDQRFSLHDLKRKGISDTLGSGSDKKDAGGHASDASVLVYSKKPIEVQPANEKGLKTINYKIKSTNLKVLLNKNI